MKLFCTTVGRIFTTIAAAILFMGYNSSSPPPGNTGAPSEGTCANCHNPGAFTGSIAITGLPSSVTPNSNYTITITLTKSGAASKGGFQVVSLFDASNSNAGSWTPGAGQNQFTTGGRTYVRQSSAPNFSGNTITWTSTWKAPVGSNGDMITMYVAGLIANGNGSTGGDNTVTGTATTTLSVSTPLTASITKTDLSCFQSADGTATAVPAGGTPPYTYLWSNGKTTATITGLAAGSYAVTVKDVNLLTAGATTALTQPNAISVSVVSQTNINCINPTGTATVAANGGAGGFSYIWPNGQTGPVATDLVQGANTVSITDANNCKTTKTITITANTTPPTATATTNDTITCKKLTALLLGSSNPTTATYKWSGPGITGNNQNQQNPTVAAGGAYTVTVTNTVNGCESTKSVTVLTNTTKPTVAMVGDTISCKDTLAVIAANTSGNTLTYLWTGPGIDTSNNTKKNPTVKKVGFYFATVTDSKNGCFKNDSTTVAKDSVAPLVTVLGDSLNCTKTSAVITANSNGNLHTYLWTGPGIDSTNNTQKNPTVAKSGLYSVTVTSPANGCKKSESTTVPIDTIKPVIGAIGDTITCTDNVGQLNVNSNLSSPTYLWSGPGINNSNKNLKNPTVFTAGSFNVIVTNPANGCASTDNTLVAVNTNAPQVALASGILTCAQTTTQIIASSNVSNAAYFWMGPGININNQTQQNPVVGSIGTYTVLVTDNTNGCTTMATTTVSEDKSTATSVASGGVLTCTQNDIQIFGDSDNNAVTFSWSGPGGFTSSVQNPVVNTAGVYTLTVTKTATGCTTQDTAIVSTDANVPVVTANSPLISCVTDSATVVSASSINNSTFEWTGPNNFVASGSSITVSQSGTYIVTVTAPNGCKATFTTTVSSPNLPKPTISGKTIICGGSTTTLTVGGGVFKTIQWTNNSGNNSITIDQAGLYSVTVTDVLNCQGTTSVDVTKDNSVSDLTVSSGELNCKVTSIKLQANNFGNSTQFGWAGPNNFASNEQGPSINNPGVYTVTVTNSNGCTQSATNTITQNLDKPVITVNSGKLDCNNPKFILKASSNLNSQFTWKSNKDIVLGQGAELEVSAGGTYTVEAIGENGCADKKVTEVTDARDLKATIAKVIEPKCYNDPKTFNATADATGGTPPYSYLWSNGEKTVSAILPFGDGQVTVTDNGGCVQVLTVKPSAAFPDSIKSITTSTDANVGQNNGSITQTVSGGKGPYTYLWSNNATSKDIGNIGAGNYCCTITDSNGCKFVICQEVKLKVGNFDLSNEFLKAYPNPTTGVVTIELLGQQSNDIRIEVLDLTGKMILREMATTIAGKYQLNLENQAAGTYWLTVYAGQKRYASRLIISK